MGNIYYNLGTWLIVIFSLAALEYTYILYVYFPIWMMMMKARQFEEEDDYLPSMLITLLVGSFSSACIRAY